MRVILFSCKEFDWFSLFFKEILVGKAKSNKKRLLTKQDEYLNSFNVKRLNHHYSLTCNIEK
jgi:hypothetical protein